ncbi:MAG: family 1 glycosylhydrolase [Parcubacteria group bacterium]
MNDNDQKFIWGVTNIGTQTEGNDQYGNWTRWARRGLVPTIGVANAYTHQYQKDHDLVKELGCNGMRLTIEWSRIEPEEGIFDQDAIMHYKKVLYDLKRRKIKTIVGLWHWNIPMWCEEKYGMHDQKIVHKFETFVEHVCENLGHLVDCIVVLNEPTVYVRSSYLAGSRPPFVISYTKAYYVARNLIAMHKSVYKLWKDKYPNIWIGSTYLWNDERGAQNTFFQRIYLWVKTYFSVTYFIHALLPYGDFIGVNYYTSDRFFFGRSGKKWGVHGTNDWHDPDVWRVFPDGLYHVLMQAKKYHKPIMILENGKPTNSGLHDKDRQEFLAQSILYMHKAIADGADVRGYFHYCLCDSYEWDSGYDFKFGLVEIDRTTGNRARRDSFFVYKKIIAGARK